MERESVHLRREVEDKEEQLQARDLELVHLKDLLEKLRRDFAETVALLEQEQDRLVELSTDLVHAHEAKKEAPCQQTILERMLAETHSELERARNGLEGERSKKKHVLSLYERERGRSVLLAQIARSFMNRLGVGGDSEVEKAILHRAVCSVSVQGKTRPKP